MYKNVMRSTQSAAVLFCRYFPKIFGPHDNEPLDKKGTMKAFEEFTEKVHPCFCHLCTHTCMYIQTHTHMRDGHTYKHTHTGEHLPHGTRWLLAHPTDLLRGCPGIHSCC